jgi:hypothetical protein
MKRSILLFAAMSVMVAASALAQVTTGGMNGVITMKDGKPMTGARVVATHVPSGSKYGAITGATGRFNAPGLRPGGPYTVEVSAIGMKTSKYSDIFVTLGENYVLNSVLEEGEVKLSEIVVTSKKGAVMSSDRTGAATSIGRETISSIPTISRNIIDFAKVTPQANGRSFGGQDNRMNNLTIDGSVFNNSFGLSGVPGGQTGQSPISLDAIEAVQVNLAPYDVRQAGFTGAGINAVTRSGDNEWRFSVFANTRNQGFAGDTVAGALPTDGAKFVRERNQFNVYQAGFRLGGPIIENKLFFFVNFEREFETRPVTNFRAQQPGETTGGLVTRVRASQLDSLRQFLISKYNYDPGLYDNSSGNYNRAIFSNKATGKLNWNIDESNKLSIRFQYLQSQAEIPTNAASNAVGARNGNNDALSFQNANYLINNDIYSAIAELNSVLSPTMTNNLIAGFTANRDYRSSNSRPFPFVDILDGRPVTAGRVTATTLTSFGYELFTPFNILNTDTWQLQDNLTIFAGDHTFTAGISAEAFTFTNGFNQRYYGYYRFNSLQDFYNSANGVAGAQPVNFSQTYSALPNGATPLAVTQAVQLGAYAQDEWNISNNFKITLGLRVDAPIFDQSTAIANRVVDSVSFYSDVTKQTEKLSTGNLPSTNLLISPRIGFNLDANGDRSFQLRGGTGIFSGRPPFVWLSNVITNNGVTAGEIVQNFPTNRAFNADPAAYIPANASATVPPATFTVNTVVPGFRFPQVWRSNLAADIQLPLGIVATVEGIYNQNIAQAFYRDANLRPATAKFTGPDNRSRFPASFVAAAVQDSAARLTRRINGNYVLDNTNQGNAYSITGQLQKTFSDGWFLMVAYTYSVSRDITSAGSIAANSWNGNQILNSPNIPEVSFSDNDNPHRLIANGSYRLDLGNIGGLTLSGFFELRTQGRISYTYQGDMNGDLVNNNDLMWVPAQRSDIILADFPTTAVKRWTQDEQWQQLDAFISKDPYLSTRRGQYTERNGGVRGWVSTIDLAATFDLNLDKIFNIEGKSQVVQVRFDILNATNLVNPSLGVGDRVFFSRPLVATGVNAAGQPIFRMNEVAAGQGLPTSGVLKNSVNFPSDVWQFQVGLRYTFN